MFPKEPAVMAGLCFDGGDGEVSEGRRGESPRSNALFSAIVATVAATIDQRLTVRDIALRLGASEEVTAQCIALHRYFRAQAADARTAGVLDIPTPADFAVPRPDEVIDETALGLPRPLARPT
jgi:hypothetical protein